MRRRSPKEFNRQPSLPELSTATSLRVIEPATSGAVPAEPAATDESVVASPDLEPATAIEAPAALVAAEAETLPPVLEVVQVTDDNDVPRAEVIGVDEEPPPPIEVFAFHAPEPAVDSYNRGWQAEAPLSVIRRPHPIPGLSAIDSQPTSQESAVNLNLDDALKQLDGTLELIRSMKRRSA